LKLRQGLLLAFVEGETQRHALGRGEGEGAVFFLVFVGGKFAISVNRRKKKWSMTN